VIHNKDKVMKVEFLLASGGYDEVGHASHSTGSGAAPAREGWGGIDF
jgi:hypothetical protein